jgi:hypothetical protein
MDKHKMTMNLISNLKAPHNGLGQVLYFAKKLKIIILKIDQISTITPRGNMIKRTGKL